MTLGAAAALDGGSSCCTGFALLACAFLAAARFCLAADGMQRCDQHVGAALISLLLGSDKGDEEIAWHRPSAPFWCIPRSTAAARAPSCPRQKLHNQTTSCIFRVSGTFIALPVGSPPARDGPIAKPPRSQLRSQPHFQPPGGTPGETSPSGAEGRPAHVKAPCTCRAHRTSGPPITPPLLPLSPQVPAQARPPSGTPAPAPARRGPRLPSGAAVRSPTELGLCTLRLALGKPATSCGGGSGGRAGGRPPRPAAQPPAPGSSSQSAVAQAAQARKRECEAGGDSAAKAGRLQGSCGGGVPAGMPAPIPSAAGGSPSAARQEQQAQWGQQTGGAEEQGTSGAASPIRRRSGMPQAQPTDGGRASSACGC